MQVVATKQGYDGLKVREPGDVFDMPENVTATWFKPVEAAEKAEKPAKEPKEKPAK